MDDNVCMVCFRKIPLHAQTWGAFGAYCSKACSMHAQEAQSRRALQREDCKNCGEKLGWGMSNGYCSMRCREEDQAIALADEAVLRSTFGIPDEVDLGLAEKPPEIKGIRAQLSWVDEANDFGDNLWDGKIENFETELDRIKDEQRRIMSRMTAEKLSEQTEKISLLGTAIPRMAGKNMAINMTTATTAFTNSMREAYLTTEKMRKMMDSE